MRNLHVYFDYQIFWLQKRGGISRYFCELASALSRVQGCVPQVVAPFHANENLREIEEKRFVKGKIPFSRRFGHNRLWDVREPINALSLKRLMTRKQSILHETYYTHRISTSKPRVTTVHDMIYEKFHSGLPDELSIIEQKRKAIESADAVIAVSSNTRNDISDIYPWAASKTVVVHHGIGLPKASPYRNKKPFILFVGNRGWYKNFRLLLDLYVNSPEIHKPFDLICFGGENASDDEKKIVKNAGLDRSVQFIGGDDHVLASLYAAAAALVYNSAYEGFGLPVLEAMLSGCPVICSNTSSLPEVAGEAALFVDPYSQHDLLNAIVKVADATVRSGLIMKVYAQVKKFSWDKCAKETFDVYRQLV